MILSNHSASQSTFLKTLGTSGNETGQLIFLEDNTPIIIGTTDSTGNGDLFVSKLDNAFNPLWSVSFGDTSDEGVSDIILAPNGNYLLSGRRNGSNVAVMSEISPSNGSIIQMTELGLAQDRMPLLLKTLDNNILSLGHLESFPSLNSRNKFTTHLLDASYTSLIRTIHDHFNGQQPEPSNTEVYTKQAIQMSDSSFLVVASHAFASNGNQSARLIRIDKNLNILSIWGYDFAEVTRMSTLVLCSNGDIVLAGYSNNYSIGTDDVALVRLDANGTHLWSKFYQTIGKQECLDVIQSADGGFLLTGNTNANGFGGRDIFVLKTDSAGTLQWAKSYGDVGDDGGLKSYISGSGYLVTGSMFTSTGGDDVFIMQIDGTGEAGVGCSINLLPFITTISRTPISLTRSYGTLTFTPPVATVANEYGLPLIAANQCITCPQADFTATNACVGDTVFITANYGANDSIVYWDYGDGNVTNTYSQFHFYPVQGNYIITHVVFNPAFACYDTFSAGISISTFPVFSLGPDTSTCGNTFQLAAPAGFGYVWNTGASTSTISAIASGLYSLRVIDGNGCTASDSINLSLLPTPSLNAGPDQTICESQCATLNATGSMNFTWYPNSLLSDSTIPSPVVCPPVTTAFAIHARSPQNHIINGDFEAGNIGFTSDYTLGSSAVGTYQVAPNPNLFNSGHFGNDHTTGTGNFLIADGSTNAFNAVWCQVVAVQQNTNYDLSLWANNITDSAVNVNDPVIQITINNLPVCSFGGTTIPELPDNWVNIACTWNSGSNTSANICIRSLNTSVVGNDFGIDDITFTTPDGCMTTDTTWVFVEPSPVVDLGNDTVLCAGNPLVLDAGNFGGTYLWSDNSTNQTLLVDSSGSFSVEVLDSLGCIGRDTASIAVIQQFNAQIDSIGPICDNDSVVLLTATDVAGLWWGNGITDAMVGLFDPSLTGAGTHIVYYGLSGNCGDTSSINIIVLNGTVATIIGPGQVCIDAPVFNIQAINSGGIWSGTGITNAASGLFDPAVAGAGTHIITYSFSGQCGDTANITIEVKDVGNPLITPVTPVCGTVEQISLSASPPGGYWFGPGMPDSTSGIFDSEDAGTGQHQIYYRDDTPCPGTDTTIIIVHPSPTVNIGNDTVLCMEESVVIGPDQQYQTYVWSNASSENQITISETGDYFLTITDSNGCAASDTISLENECLAIIDFPTAFTPNSDGVNDWFHAMGSPANQYELSVFNRWGEKVFQTSEFSQHWDGLFRGKAQPVGSYVWVAKLVLNGNLVERSGNVTLIR